MTYFVRHQKGLFERASYILVNDERNLSIKACVCTIQERSTGDTWLHGNPKGVRDTDHEFIRRPRVATTLNRLIMQPFGVLSRELYSVHGYSSLRNFDKASSSYPASLRILSNDTFSAATGLVLDLLARS
ncbi:hypothetical protein JAB6_28220 [Janthinobacterium sp. HH104]|nr:hypothetical protein JAB6_28220 [Janthinobacterium sp. HH104]